VALSNTRGGIRWWACQISERFPSPDLIEPLAEVLSVGNEDERFAAVTSLGAIEDPKVSQTLRSALNNETLQDIKEHILSTIEFNRKKQLRD
jgi:HEAT repeat protein